MLMSAACKSMQLICRFLGASHEINGVPKFASEVGTELLHSRYSLAKTELEFQLCFRSSSPLKV
eukprot:6179367-Pleurochrysis_carterae.AAC.5